MNQEVIPDYQNLSRLSVSDIRLIEDCLELKQSIESERVPKMNMNKLDEYEIQTLILMCAYHRLSAGDAMKLLDIPSNQRRSVKNRLDSQQIFIKEVEDPPKDIKFKVGTLRKSVLKQAKRGRPSFIYSYDSAPFIEVKEIEKQIPKESFEKIIEITGLGDALRKFFKEFFQENQEVFVKLIGDINDILVSELSRKRLANFSFDYPLEYVRGVNYPGELI